MSSKPACLKRGRKDKKSGEEERPQTRLDTHPCWGKQCVYVHTEKSLEGYVLIVSGKPGELFDCMREP